ncbi:hypothetical protein C922_03395 [Plasmodium inui San Antonio 1]|uniref:RRM domain-containing protein n=1 Tax=Plasmodium inui San Antonio 1 TaxID=1237626 RepID=W7A3H1_9APIC|nr:hypothetical protein C922_03395 [Plasmodium inui San Antonio 1]EUD66200.1 hypothetical protein C922_03395 [Plasmodium inui San Antonio 1]
MAESSCASEYFVSNLPYDVTEEELKDFFKPTCEVTYCRVKRTKIGIKTCHGYVQFGGNPNGVAAYARRKKLKGRQLRIELVENGNDDQEDDEEDDGAEDGEGFPPWQKGHRDGRHPSKGSTKQQKEKQAKYRDKWNSNKENESIELIDKKGMITKQGHAILSNMNMYDVVLLIDKMQQLIRVSPQTAIRFLSDNKTVYYSLVHALFLVGILSIEMNPLSEEDIIRMKFHALKNKFQFLCLDSEEPGEVDALGGKQRHKGGGSGWNEVDWGNIDWGEAHRSATEWRDADRGASERGASERLDADRAASDRRGSDPGEGSDRGSQPWGGQNYNYEPSGRRPLYERGGKVNAVNMPTPSSLTHMGGKNQPGSNRKNVSRGLYSASQSASYGGNLNNYASINHVYVPSEGGQSGYPVDRDSSFGEMERDAVKTEAVKGEAATGEAATGEDQMVRSNLYGTAGSTHHSRQQFTPLNLSMNKRRGDPGGYPLQGIYSKKHTMKGEQGERKNKKNSKESSNPKKLKNLTNMMPLGSKAVSGKLSAGGGSRPVDYDSDSMQGNPNPCHYGQEFPSGRSTGLYAMRGHVNTKMEKETYYSNYYARDYVGEQRGEEEGTTPFDAQINYNGERSNLRMKCYNGMSQLRGNNPPEGCSSERTKDNISNCERNDGTYQSDHSEVSGIDARSNQGGNRTRGEAIGGQSTSVRNWRRMSRKGHYQGDSEAARSDIHTSDHEGENREEEKHLELGKRLIQKINTSNSQRRGIKLIDRNRGNEKYAEESVIKVRSVDLCNEVENMKENLISSSLKAVLRKVNLGLKDIPYAEEDLVKEVINEKPILENILISKYSDMVNWNRDQILRVLSIRKSLKSRGYNVNGVI